MEISAEALREELKTLRKGRGVHTPRIDEQIGPQLRAVCEIDPTDGPGVIRDKLISRLGALAKSLPDDYALAVTAALGIHPDAQDPFLNLRIEWVARRIQRDDRTARRRVDDAINRLAEAAARKAAAPTAAVAEVKRDLWYTEESTVGLRLDGTEPLMIERRLMVAESDDIRQLELGVTIPRGEDGRMAYEPNIEVLYGGTLIERPVGNYSQFKFALQLPKPLMRGDPRLRAHHQGAADQAHAPAFRAGFPAPMRPVRPARAIRHEEPAGVGLDHA